MTDFMKQLAKFQTSANVTSADEIFRPNSGQNNSQLVGFTTKFDDPNDPANFSFTWKKGGGGSVCAWSFTPRYIYLSPGEDGKDMTWFGRKRIMANLSAEEVLSQLPEGNSSEGGKQRTRNEIAINSLRKWLGLVLSYEVNDEKAARNEEGVSNITSAITDLDAQIMARVEANEKPFELSLNVTNRYDKERDQHYFDEETVLKRIEDEATAPAEPVTA